MAHSTLSVIDVYEQVQWMVGLFFTFAFTLIAAMFGVSLL